MGTKIYKNGVLLYRGQKGPGHKCDRKCKAANHWYQHEFKLSRGPAIGSPDKQSVQLGNLVLSKAGKKNPPLGVLLSELSAAKDVFGRKNGKSRRLTRRETHPVQTQEAKRDFAHLMQTARKRKLTESEKKLLAKVREVLSRR